MSEVGPIACFSFDFSSISCLTFCTEKNDPNKVKVLSFVREILHGADVLNNPNYVNDYLKHVILSTIDASEKECKQRIKNIIFPLDPRYLIFTNLKSHVIHNTSYIIDDSTISKLFSGAIEYFNPKKKDVEVLDVIMNRYNLDNTSIVEDPIGASCKEIESDIGILYANTSAIENISQVAKFSRVKILNCTSIFYAKSILLTKKNKSNSCLIIDIDKCSTGFSVIIGSNIKYLASFPVGFFHIVQDISYILNISLDESIMINDDNRDIGLEKDINKTVLYNVVYARVDEIINSIIKMLRQSNIDLSFDEIILLKDVSRVVKLEFILKDIFPNSEVFFDYDKFYNKYEYHPSYMDCLSLANYYIDWKKRSQFYLLKKIPIK